MRPTPSRERERAVAGLPGLLCIQAHGRRRLSRQRIAHQRETAATAGGFHFVQDIVRRQADQALGVRHAGGARAGKDVYPLPTMVNVWNGGYGTNDNWERFDRPGETYPSGGAVSHMLDLWKANAPAIDVIASDIYHQSPITYLKILDNYRRPDNPLLIVETGREIAGRAFFYAMADFSAIGFGPFGVDGGGGELRPDMAAVAADFRLFKSAIPAIAELQGTPRLKAAVEETGIGARNLVFRNYDLLVRFSPSGRAPAGTIGQPAAAAASEPSARVMIAELGGDEFLVMGFDSSVEWRPAQGVGLHGGSVPGGRGGGLRKRSVENDRHRQHLAGRLHRSDGKASRTGGHDAGQTDEVLSGLSARSG